MVLNQRFMSPAEKLPWDLETWTRAKDKNNSTLPFTRALELEGGPSGASDMVLYTGAC